MNARTIGLLFALFLPCVVCFAADAPLTPEQAREKVGERVVVKMKVQAAKNRLEKRGEIYLDSELSFRDPKNFAAVITRAGAMRLAEQGTADPAEHFLGKTILVRGVVRLVEDVPRIEIDEPQQVEIAREE